MLDSIQKVRVATAMQYISSDKDVNESYWLELEYSS